jgi:two-component system alkaline phosphatase synthesis response regulator PhoP
VKVLLVSPDPETREMMQVAVADLARGDQVEFFEATNGERGIKRAWKEMPDVVIADEIASRAGAFALAHELRGAPEPFEGVIVILLDRSHDQWLAKWSGADAWFVKPVDPFELTSRIRSLLDREPAQA